MSHIPRYVPMEHREVIISLCSKLGIPISLRGTFEPRSHMWDGHTMAVNNWQFETYDIIHEIAHWLIAEDRRHLPDFGLGTGPDSYLHAECVVDEPDIEEEKASVLGILYERALGLEWKVTFACHGWDEMGSYKLFLRRYKDLVNMGPVRCGGRPTVMP